MMYLLFLALACAPGPADPGTRTDTPTDATPVPTAPSTTPGGTTPDPTVGTEGTTAGDAELAQAIIDGTVAPSDGLQELAWSGGLPVRTDTGYLFLYVGDGSWSVAGDFDGWAGTPMAQGANHVWWVEVPIADPPGVHYKFTNGPDWLADPWARSYTYDGNGEISYVRPPTDTFRLDRWPGWAGHGEAPRTVRVYVPPGTGPFPTMYAEDGQNLFDPDAFWGGWRMQDALATVDPMIVVGIDNTADRFEEYTHVTDIVYGYEVGGDGTDYAAFLTEDIKPVIDATYPTSGLDGLIGSSLGGLISLYVAHEYPADYDFAASMSGTLGWGSFELQNPVMEELFHQDAPGFVKVYVDSGGDPGPDGGCQDRDGDGFVEDDPDDSDNYCINRQFADDLAAAGWEWDANLWHWWEEGAEHNEAYWADRVDRPLAIFAGLDD